MKILLACEKTQTVCIEMRKRGHEAFSCDIQPCSGNHPEWHIQGDVLKVINGFALATQDGAIIFMAQWDIIIAFPPCTHLAVSGSGSFEQKRKDGRQQKAIDFFMQLVNAPVNMIAIENPIGIMSTEYRKPDQIVHPYYFGDPHPKSTCLWLKNLPLLFHLKESDLFDFRTHVKPEYLEYNSKKTKSGKSRYSIFGKLGKGKGEERSVTFPGIAKAMATQWTKNITKHHERAK